MKSFPIVIPGGDVIALLLIYAATLPNDFRVACSTSIKAIQAQQDAVAALLLLRRELFEAIYREEFGAGWNLL